MLCKGAQEPVVICGQCRRVGPKPRAFAQETLTFGFEIGGQRDLSGLAQLLHPLVQGFEPLEIADHCGQERRIIPPAFAVEPHLRDPLTCARAIIEHTAAIADLFERLMAGTHMPAQIVAGRARRFVEREQRAFVER